MRRSFKILLGICALLAAAALIAALFGGGIQGRAYDRELWIAQSGVDPLRNRRAPMLPEVEKRLRLGMATEEVLDLLGPPDARSDARFTYELGVRIIDYDSFLIEFDADGRVTGWRVDYG